MVGGKEDVLKHWGSEHSSVPLAQLSVRGSAGYSVPVARLWKEVARCTRCRGLVGCGAGGQAQAVKEHYSTTHDRQLANVRAPDHFTTVWEEGGERGLVQGLGPLDCRVQGCSEKGLVNYSKHYTEKHR